MNRTLNMKTKKIAIGSDHAGFESKEKTRSELLGLGLEVVDKGTNSLASVDYPDFAAAVGRAVVSGEVEASPMGRGQGFDAVWRHMTGRLLSSYSDSNYVSASYAAGSYWQPTSPTRAWDPTFSLPWTKVHSCSIT